MLLFSDEEHEPHTLSHRLTLSMLPHTFSYRLTLSGTKADMLLSSDEEDEPVALSGGGRGSKRGGGGGAAAPGAGMSVLQAVLASDNDVVRAVQVCLGGRGGVGCGTSWEARYKPCAREQLIHGVNSSCNPSSPTHLAVLQSCTLITAAPGCPRSQPSRASPGSLARFNPPRHASPGLRARAGDCR